MLSRRNGSRGFTLIELLIVMAVIAMLAGIGYPMFMKAKDLANTVKCKANLRGIARGISMYHAAFEGWLPPFHDGDTEGVEDETEVQWKMIVSTYCGNYSLKDLNRDDVPLSKAFLDPTRGDGKGVYMASKGQLGPISVIGKGSTNRGGYYDAATYDAAQKKWRNGERHGQNSIDQLAKYLANNPSIAGGVNRPMNIQEFKYLTQAGIVGPSKDPKVHLGYSGKDDNPETSKLDAFDFRHRGGIANILFLDGHVDEYNEEDKHLKRKLLDRWNVRHLRDVGLE